MFLSRYRGYQTCPDCGGTRLRREARDVRVGDLTIDEVSALTVREAEGFFDALRLSEKDAAIVDKVLNEIRRRLGFLRDVGLDYLTLDRLSSTLSGGEAQRINLATSLGSALVGTLYVLDEPSIGLHPRDNQRLIAILRQLRDQGNTVLVVEHDADMIAVADHVVDMGLGAGEHGGRVVYAGTLEGLAQEPRSLTAKYWRGELSIPVPADAAQGHAAAHPADRRARAQPEGREHRDPAQHAHVHHRRERIGQVHAGARRALRRAQARQGRLGPEGGRARPPRGARVRHRRGARRSDADRPHAALESGDLPQGLRSDPRAVRRDQGGEGARHDRQPLLLQRSGRPLRGLPGRGRGEGRDAVPRRRLRAVRAVRGPPLQVRRSSTCAIAARTSPRCSTSPFARRWRSSRRVPKVLRRLQVLDEIGLGYLRLGQPATTLSGGEAQRIKIAAHLASHAGERLLYILDEPTTGLHFDDIAKLLSAFRKLLEAGHTLAVIEHNLDVIKTADWIIDLGPEGGEEGGQVMAMGTPEQVAQVPASHTGRYLQQILASNKLLQTVELMTNRARYRRGPSRWWAARCWRRRRTAARSWLAPASRCRGAAPRPPSTPGSRARLRFHPAPSPS